MASSVGFVITPIAPAIPLPSVLRILVVIASPAGLPALDLEGERQQITAAWGRQKRVEVCFPTRGTVAALRQELLERPIHAVHYMGHGGFDPATGQGVLYFETEHGAPDPVSGSALAGSWDPLTLVPDRWGLDGGRIYVTAMHLLNLEVYYRHLPPYRSVEGVASRPATSP